MSDHRVRRADRIFEPDFVAGVESMPTTELRSRRDACREVEAEFSYARRLLQGKIDILGAELKRRSEGGETGAGELIGRLPAILADEPRSSGGATRMLQSDLPGNAGKYQRQTERLATMLADVETSSVPELTALVDELAAEEKKVSANRRKAQQLVDELNAELVRRYRKGDEDPTALLRF